MKPSDSLLCSTVLASALALAGPGKFCVLITLHKFVFINRQWHWALGIGVYVCVGHGVWGSGSCLHLHLFGAAVKYFMAVKKSKSSECLHFVRAWQGCGCCCWGREGGSGSGSGRRAERLHNECLLIILCKSCDGANVEIWNQEPTVPARSFVRLFAVAVVVGIVVAAVVGCWIFQKAFCEAFCATFFSP